MPALHAAAHIAIQSEEHQVKQVVAAPSHNVTCINQTLMIGAARSEVVAAEVSYCAEEVSSRQVEHLGLVAFINVLLSCCHQVC